MIDSNAKSEGLIVGGILLSLLIAWNIPVSSDNTHYCETLQIAKKCDRLSSTGLTCYPEPDTRKGSKYCETGWKLIIEDDIQEIEQYLCHTNGTCNRI